MRFPHNFLVSVWSFHLTPAYIYCYPQTVLLYHNSSVWLDTLDASSCNRNAPNFTLPLSHFENLLLLEYCYLHKCQLHFQNCFLFSDTILNFTFIYTYIYIYRERERLQEREGEVEKERDKYLDRKWERESE